MAKVAVDFGTGNTVLARFNETLGRAETIEIPGITTRYEYFIHPDKPKQFVHVVPSLIHYSDSETLIGDQVLSRGLADHPDTIRWMKRGIAQRVTKRQKTAHGHKSPAQAGEDFLTLLLNYVSDQISLADDEFTFTVPTEAFEDFQDWLRSLVESLGIRRLRVLDEPTACVLGYHGAARKDDRFLVFDFGCGTLDVAVVRIDLAERGDKKSAQLGRAGVDLGGMNIDTWLAGAFCTRHSLDNGGRDLAPIILRQAEAAKILLSDPRNTEAEIQVLDRSGRVPRVFSTTFSAACRRCYPRANNGTADACLGCLLDANDFSHRVRETIDRALENAAIKAGVRRGDLVKVLVTGGTSLMPPVRRLLVELFDKRAVLANPFDAVARGACQGDVETILQHDYAIGSYDPQGARYKPLFKIGTEYPTDPQSPVKKVISGTADGQTRCGLFIYEVSQMKRPSLGTSIVDANGVLRDDSQGDSDYAHICLNRDNPTFIVADPPINLTRDTHRFLCSFRVDGHRRLLVTVVDNLAGNTLLKDHPVVRL